MPRSECFMLGRDTEPLTSVWLANHMKQWLGSVGMVITPFGMLDNHGKGSYQGNHDTHTQTCSNTHTHTHTHRMSGVLPCIIDHVDIGIRTLPNASLAFGLSFEPRSNKKIRFVGGFSRAMRKRIAQELAIESRQREREGAGHQGLSSQDPSEKVSTS